MPQEVLLPQLGFSMTDGGVAEWLVRNGASVEVGTPLFSIETDKAVEEVQSSVAGKIRILKEAGRTYPVGEVLAIIE